MTRMRFEIAGKTDPGCVRENNEDNMALAPELGLLVVADGMGGHNSGEVASSMAVKEILEFGRKMMAGPAQIIPEGSDPSKPPRSRQLEYFVKTANTIIFEKSRQAPQYQGMGTTVVAMVVDDGMATVAHVGDSRLYVLRNGALQALTQDHSVVMDYVRSGRMTSEEAGKSHLQNFLTRALGTEPEVQVDIGEHPVLAGDVLLLCTDGLTKMVPEAEITRVLQEPRPLQELCDQLIEMARAGGGVDNVTVAAARALVPEGPLARLKGLARRIFQGGTKAP